MPSSRISASSAVRCLENFAGRTSKSKPSFCNRCRSGRRRESFDSRERNVNAELLQAIRAGQPGNPSADHDCF